MTDALEQELRAALAEHAAAMHARRRRRAACSGSTTAQGRCGTAAAVLARAVACRASAAAAALIGWRWSSPSCCCHLADGCLRTGAVPTYTVRARRLAAAKPSCKRVGGPLCSACGCRELVLTMNAAGISHELFTRDRRRDLHYQRQAVRRSVGGDAPYKAHAARVGPLGIAERRRSDTAIRLCGRGSRQTTSASASSPRRRDFKVGGRHQHAAARRSPMVGVEATVENGGTSHGGQTSMSAASCDRHGRQVSVADAQGRSQANVISAAHYSQVPERRSRSHRQAPRASGVPTTLIWTRP